MSIGRLGRPRLTGSPLGSIVAQWGRRGVVKLIQTGTIDLNNTASGTNSPAITTVDPNNALLLHLGHNSAYAGAGFVEHQYTRLTLTNGTTITATCGAAIASAIPVKWALIEFYSGVLRSIQYNTIDLTTLATNTRTITAVDVTKSTVFSLGQSDTQVAASAPSQVAHLALTSATVVTGTVSAINLAITASFVVPEFY